MQYKLKFFFPLPQTNDSLFLLFKLVLPEPEPDSDPEPEPDSEPDSEPESEPEL